MWGLVNQPRVGPDFPRSFDAPERPESESTVFSDWLLVSHSEVLASSKLSCTPLAEFPFHAVLVPFVPSRLSGPSRWCRRRRVVSRICQSIVKSFE